jgi:hypothetical protein
MEHQSPIFTASSSDRQAPSWRTNSNGVAGGVVLNDSATA